MESSFGLTIGSTIEVRLLAYNQYGESEYSPVASNIELVWKPDPVRDLQTHYTPNLAMTTDTQVGLTWSNGA